MMNETDLTNVDLNLLVLFEAVFRERHVGSAAERLHVSSSAVSHGLGRLRRLFGDPLFLRVPKGVVPTARAGELAPAVTEILSRVRTVIGGVEAFDPATSARRFTLGATDATLAALLPPLITALRREAPRVDLGTRHLFPMNGLDELDTGTLDLAVLPLDDIPARFFSRKVFEDEFVIAARAGHPFLRAPSLRRYCELLHILVSITADTNGYIDGLLAKKKLSRRIALTVPNFILALAALGDTDLIAAVPKGLVAMHGPRFGVASVPAPLSIRRWPVRAIVPKVAMADPGIAWLFGAVARAGEAPPEGGPPGSRRAARNTRLGPSTRRASGSLTAPV